MNAHIDRFVIGCLDEYVSDGDCVLDLGCGAQPFRSLILAKGGNYIGLDYTLSQEQHANVLADASLIPLKSQSIQLALCSELLEHVPSISAVLAETYRVLAPGATMIITVPFMFGLHEEPFDFGRPTAHTLRREAEASGFGVARVVPLGNEAEVIATTWDTMWSWRLRSRRPGALSVLAVMRVAGNCAGSLFSALLSARSPQAYLNTAVVVQKPGVRELSDTSTGCSMVKQSAFSR